MEKNLKNNFDKNLHIKNLHIYIFIFSFIILNLYIGIKFLIKQNYINNFVRLHIVANSNSIDDQIDKFKVSEKITNYIDTLNLPSNITNEEIMSILNTKSNELLTIANSTSNYNSTLKIGTIHYDKKQNVICDMPSGNYDSVQVILGNGEGKNIWSFISPNEENIQNIQSYESIFPGISKLYDNNNTTEKDYSFKVIEIIKNIVKK